jgi:pilus assembly protein CpaE
MQQLLERNAVGRVVFAMSVPNQISDTFIGTGAMSIAVISPDVQRREAATGALGGCYCGQIREFDSYPSDLSDVSRILGNNFDVVLIDLDSDPEYALDLVESICINSLATVMVYSERTDSEMLVRCMRAGAREFLTLPFDHSAMCDAVIRASALRPAVRPAKTTNGRLLVFLSAKGGSGVSTLACNFAVSMAQESGKKILLIDLNLPLGDAAINLGIKSDYSTINALQNSSRLDASFFSTLIAQHSSGLSVLAAPSVLTPAHFTDDAIDKLVEVACQEFDYVVVDAGSRLNLQGTALFNKSATVYLVTQVGIPELRNSNRLISQFSTTESPTLEIVINRFEPRALEINEEHIEKALTRPVKWKIPNDYAAVRRMQNTATPLALENTPISRMIQKMARAACGLPDLPEKKKGFSFFRGDSSS